VLVFILVIIFILGMAVLVFILVIVMHIDHGKLNGIYALTKRDNLGLICTGVVYQFMQPFAFQAETDSKHNIGVSYLGNVASAWQKSVRIATHWQQAEDLDPASTYHPGPISHKVGGCHHPDRRPGGRISLLGSCCTGG